MPLVIDGHNLIGQMPGRQLADPEDELRLVQLLRRAGKQGIVFFDGGQPGGASLSTSVLAVRFARSPQTADDAILDYVLRQRNPRGLTVVTADARVKEACRRRGAAVQDARALARELAALERGERPSRGSAASPKEKGLSPEEAAAWEREFQQPKPAGTPSVRASGRRRKSGL